MYLYKDETYKYLMLNKSQISKMEKLFKSLNKNEEFEVMFGNFKRGREFSITNFMKVLKYMKWKSDSDNLKLSKTVSLDISYNYEHNSNYRVTINGKDDINNFLNLVHKRKNHVIFSILMTQFLKNDSVILVNKEKDKKYVIDFDDIDIRIRKSKEFPVNNKIINDLANLPLSHGDKIYYRFKERLSLNLLSKEPLNIDLTIVKDAKNPNNLQISEKKYELEIDYSPLKKINSKVFSVIINEMENIKKILSNSDIVIGNNEKIDIIMEYKKLTYGGNNNDFKNLYSMQPISAEVQHVVDKIPNKYCVTDKADGEKFQLFIFNETLYLISNNLSVRKINKKIKGFNNTILEGELIHLTSSRKYLLMIFDCLFFKGNDVKNEKIIRNRLEYIFEVCKALGSKLYKHEDYKGKFDMKLIRKYYQSKIEEFFVNLNNNISNMKFNDIFFHPKFFIFPSGGSSSEVFLFNDLIYTNCTKNEKINCPYNLDGIIYTGLEQKYTRDKREQKLPMFKFKPPETNSIDIYVKFKRNFDLGGYLEIFDNSLPNKIENQNFRVVEFFVGDYIGNKEVPVPFMKNNDNHEAYFPIDKGEVRDIEGNIVLDKTVIEVIYNNDPDIPHPYRWIILRTRWDKTESIRKYNRKYGNYKDVAIKTWKSMREAVTMEEIRSLSDPETYESQRNTLSSRIDNTVVATDRQQDIYYQKTSNLIRELRGFHNWIKSIIIYGYCWPDIKNKDGKYYKKSVLDMGCGRGGDVMKWFHAKIKEYVGFDPDYEGIYSSIDGAISRYNSRKKVFPDFYKGTFLQADGSLELNLESQSNRFPNLTQQNKNILKSVFTKDRKFDVISSQFAIHYLFDKEDSVNNLISNINNFLKIDGYVIFTLFDGETVNKAFNDKGNYTAYYTDDDGKKLKLFDIKKKYNNFKDDFGMAIDVHMSWFSDKYIQEYLVSKKLMINVMEKAGCELIDTDLFQNLYNINRDWFDKVIDYEENPKNKKFYKDVSKFYEKLNTEGEQSKKWNNLYRYYVFKKTK